MPLFLKTRQVDLVELMDKADCNPKKLKNTYRQFSTINALLSQWKLVYKTILRPLMRETQQVYTLLDIGFGGGDIPVALSGWAKKDGVNLKITAIEMDSRSVDFVQELPENPNIEYRHCNSSDLVRESKLFDFVISNHVIHHLDEVAFEATLKDAKSLAKRMVIFNDIERSDLGYLLFNIFSRPLFRDSFITEDGLTSIKRSYTKKELLKVISSEWKVQRLFPFRLLLIHE